MLEGTTISGQPVGDIWNDYSFELPASDKTSSAARPLPQCSYLTRCSDCRGKGLMKCPYYECRGSGKITCRECHGTRRIMVFDHEQHCRCDTGKQNCEECRGSGEVRCSDCKGYGGFRHSVTLKVEWKTQVTKQYYQNSFLPVKHMEKAQIVLFWANTQPKWSKASSIQDFFLSLHEDEAHENIQLKGNIMKQYQEKHLQPNSSKDNKIPRLICTIERLDFEEIHYNLDKQYTNKKDPSLGSCF